MDSYNFSKDCKAIRTLMNLGQVDFAKQLGVSFSAINRIENNHHEALIDTKEKVYAFGYKNKVKNLFFNKVKTSLYLDNYKNILFHGTDREIEGNLDLKHSRDKIDFGKGFYLGESYESTRNFVSYKEDNVSVYIFKFDLSNLNVVTFDVSIDWALAISYYRGMLDEYKENAKLQQIIKQVESADVIIAPIADNTIFDLVNEFARGDITDVQLANALSASFIGKQFVFKSIKALRALTFVDRLYVAKNEIADAKKARREQMDIGVSKADLSKKEHRREGKYIEELLK